MRRTAALSLCTRGLWVGGWVCVYAYVAVMETGREVHTVFAMDVRFVGVYTPAYSQMLNAPMAATIGLTAVASSATPAAPDPAPTANAWSGLRVRGYVSVFVCAAVCVCVRVCVCVCFRVCVLRWGGGVDVPYRTNDQGTRARTLHLRVIWDLHPLIERSDMVWVCCVHMPV